MFSLKVSAASVSEADPLASTEPLASSKYGSGPSAGGAAVHHGCTANRSANKVLQYLKRKGHLFEGSMSLHDSEEELLNKLPTGYRGLDKALKGGLSTGHLHEVQLLQTFSGESRLLKASLAYANEHQSPVFWVNPPAIPSLHGMNCAGRSELSNLTASMPSDTHQGVVRTSQTNREQLPQQASQYYLHGLDSRELQWSVLQILQSVGRAVLYIWHPQPDAQMVRSWQRAMQKVPQTFAMVFSGAMPQEARAYQTRIRLNLQSNNVYFEVLKRQGGWPTHTKPEPLAV